MNNRTQPNVQAGPRRPSCRGTTLIETLVVLGLSGLVLGSFITFYISGSKQASNITEHAALRAEALKCLEIIGRDLEQLTVANDGVWPESNQYMITEPYQLDDVVTSTVFGAVDVERVAGRRLTFYRYHHIEMIPDVFENHLFPQVVAQRIEYKTVPVDPSDPAKGFDLFRNDKKINFNPLYDVFFQKVPKIVAIEQVQGSPNAFIEVVVVPKGKKMSASTLESLKDKGAVLRRKFHLIGYESQYTTILNLAIERVQSNTLGQAPKTEDDLLDPYQLAVLEHARAFAGDDNFLFDGIEKRIKEGNTLGFRMPEKTVRLDHGPFEDRTSNSDPFFRDARAEIQEVDPTTLDGEGLGVGNGGFSAEFF